MYKKLAPALAVLAVVVFGPGATTATASSQLEIQFLGIDLIYDGANVHDATSALGGLAVTSEADPLTAIKYMVDGVEVSSTTTDIFTDIFIAGVEDLPASGGSVTSLGNDDSFGFDLLTEPDKFLLALNLDEVQLFYTGSEIAISGGALASSVVAQMLPEDLVIDETQPVTIAFSSANLSNVQVSDGIVTGFTASGTGNIRAMLVPEPSMGLTVAIGLLTSILGWRRRV